jgi:GT2 family glycosyltransferase
MAQDTPLFSIMCMVRDRAWGIKRCLDAALAQEYPHIELVVADGGSTDGTLEIIKSYGDRVRLISESDNGPEDAFFKLLNAVRGEFFCFTLSDEALLPDALTRAYAELCENPDLCAITGDLIITDETFEVRGEEKGVPWDTEKYLCSRMIPHFAASFFRTSHWKETGFDTPTYCGDFEFWLRLVALHPVRYVPGAMAYYAAHGDALSYQSKRYLGAKKNCIAAIDRFLSLPGAKPYAHLRSQAVGGLYVLCADELVLMKEKELALHFYLRASTYDLDAALRERVTAALREWYLPIFLRVAGYLAKGKPSMAESMVRENLGVNQTTDLIVARMNSDMPAWGL